MPPTTSYRFGDIVLVPFPFTDQTGIKKRPAIVVSSAGYQAQRRDVVIMAVTSRMRTTPALGTIEKKLVIKKLGSLQRVDRESLQNTLRAILG